MVELIKSDTFWSALSALATLVGAAAILFAARQLRFEAWLKAQDIWVSNDFTVARGKLFARRCRTSPFSRRSPRGPAHDGAEFSEDHGV